VPNIKNPKYTFCRQFYYDEVTVTRFINIKYGDVAAEVIL